MRRRRHRYSQWDQCVNPRTWEKGRARLPLLELERNLSRFVTRIQCDLIHEPYALPIALARSYESFVLSEMENPSDGRVNNADWASS